MHICLCARVCVRADRALAHSETFMRYLSLSLSFCRNFAIINDKTKIDNTTIKDRESVILIM